MDGFHRMLVGAKSAFSNKKKSCPCSAKCSAEPKDGLWLTNILSKSEWSLDLEKNWVDRNFRNLDVVVLLICLSPQTNLRAAEMITAWKAGTPQIRDFQWFSSTSDTSLKHHLSWEMLGAWVGLAHKMSGWLGSNLNWSQPSVISNA